MNINSYKRGAAAVAAIALLAASFAGCNSDSQDTKSQVSENASQNVSESSSQDNGSDAVDTLDKAPDLADTEDIPFEEVVISEEDYDDDMDLEMLEKDGFTYYVMNDAAYIVEYNGSGKDVTIPEKLGDAEVKSLNLEIFSYNDTVKKITLPYTVAELDASMHENSVESIEISDKSEYFASADGVLFNKDKTSLIRFPCGKSGDYTIPDTVKTIEMSAFCDCSMLKELTISKNVSNLNGYCLNNCISLTEFKLSGKNENYSVKDGVLYNQSGDELIIYPTGKTEDFKMPDNVKTIGAYAFAYNENIKKAELSAELTEIGDEAFSSCISLSEVKFGSKLQTIGDGAFMNCESLAKVELPESVSSLGSYAFVNCFSLTEINIPKNVSSISFDTFSYCEQLAKVSADKDNKNYTVKDNVLYNKDITEIVLYPSCREGDYEIPDSVKSIGVDIFYSCPNMTKLTIPASVEEIEEFALQTCFFLKSVEVSADNKNYASVGGVLYNKDKTEILYIPSELEGEIEITAGVEELDSDLFFNLTNFAGFKVDSENKNYTAVDGVLFNKDKTILAKVPAAKSGEYKVPDGVKEIGMSAFYGCGDITSVTVPEGVEIIQSSAFDNSGVEKVYIPKTVEYIGVASFGYCDSITDIYYSGSEKDWNSIEIDIENDNLTDGTVTVHYDSK